MTLPLSCMVGVAPTPAATAWLVSARAARCCSPVATQACQAPISRPDAVAIAVRRSAEKAPWFSPIWLAKVQSWNGQ